jgi:hypothetical protein
MFVAILLLKNNLYREVKKIRQISILNFKGYKFEDIPNFQERYFQSLNILFNVYWFQIILVLHFLLDTILLSSQECITS